MARSLRRTSRSAYQTATSVAMFAGLALAAAALTGCAGHGEYTKQHISAAQEKMAMLKSGTDWQMAQQQFLGGDLPKSLKTVDRSLAMNPNVPKSHVLRGRILMEMGRLEDARQSFLAAESLDPNVVDAQYYLGIIDERVAHFDDALKRYKNAMQLDTGNAQYVIAASEMLITQARLDEAETLLDERAQYFAYNPAVKQTQGHIAMLRNEYPKAVQCFNDALLLAPGDMHILEDMTHAQIGARQFADAEVNLTRILKAEHGETRRDLRELQARCLVALNRLVEARTLLMALTTDKDGGRDLYSWIELGNVCITLKDKINLRQAAARVQAMAPDRVDGYFLRAMYCRLDNRPEDALAAADTAISKTPKDPKGYLLRALVLKELDRPTEARETLARALQVDPNNEQAQALYATYGGDLRNTVTTHPDAAN